jgi:DNA-binding NarL/FixJ family response regulator
MMSAKLILADDNPATRSALAFILGQRLGLGIAGESASAGELTDLLRAGVPDGSVLVLDWDLPGLNQDRGLAELRALNPPVKIVVLSARAEARQQALAAGADAFVSMVEPPEMMLSTIHNISK